MHPFTFVDVASQNVESCSFKRIKIEAPESEDDDSTSNVVVKMEIKDDEYDSKDFLPKDLHISDIAIPPAEFSAPNARLDVAFPPADFSAANIRLDNDDSSMFGEHVARSLRALTHDSSRVKLKMLIDKAIKEVIKSDLLSKS